jgi:outer membrane cobalamin receptor
MRPDLPRRQPAAGLLSLFVVWFLFGASGRAADHIAAGIVVDPDGRAVPRAQVRVVAGAAAASEVVFADERGRFEIAVPEAAVCRLEVTLTGFESRAIACPAAGAAPLNVTLEVAAVREHVLVTATRTDAPASQVGASATVFTADTLERRQTPLLADLLASTPGAMVVRNGAPGALASLFVRGGESDYNKILLDGVPLNGPGGSYYLTNLTTEHLDRVEIVRGAYSSLFGSDAMASVVQLFTRRADGTARGPRGTAQIDGGTYGTLHATAGVSGATRRVDYSAGVASLTTDHRVPNNRLKNTTLSMNLGVRLGRATTLRFVGRGELEHTGTPGPTAFGRPDLDAFFERNDGIFSVSLERAPSGAVRHQASYSIARSRQTSTNLHLDPPFTATFDGRAAIWQSTDFLNDSRTDLRRHHGSYQLDARLPAAVSAGDHRLTVIADWDGERAAAEDRLGRTATANSRNNAGAAIQHQALWPRLFAVAGVRVERNGSFGTAVVPRASLVLMARSGSASIGDTRLKISAGTGIKEPAMIESFSASPYFRGNPGLRPERSRSIEAGVDQRFADGRGKAELTWFDNRFTDIISLVSNPITFEGQYFNVGATDARGLELNVEAAPIAAVSVRASYTFLDSAIVDSTAPGNVLFAPGQWAFWRPRHSGSAGVSFQWNRIAADLNGVFVGRFVDSDFGLFDPPLTDNPGHTTWDARLSLRVTRQLTGILIVDNLTNADYSAPFGYQPLGRAIRAGARVAF